MLVVSIRQKTNTYSVNWLKYILVYILDTIKYTWGYKHFFPNNTDENHFDGLLFPLLGLIFSDSVCV